MPSLRFFLLGALEIQHDNQPLPKPPTQKSQSLLAYLALHRQAPQRREHLADLFWGDRPEHRARRSLTTALCHIRRCLPREDLLLADAHSAQLDLAADVWLDVAEFESLAGKPDLASLRSAVALYRGDFMDGFYDDWVLNERYRVETLFSEALARLMVGLETEGDLHGALAAASRLLQQDPLREDAHRLVMRAKCRVGQRNAALEQYRRCQEIVQQELGPEPMAETTELYQAILAGRFEIGPPPEGPAAAAIVGPARPPGQNPLEPVVRIPLVGREPEMAFLLDRYQEAQAGHGRLVLIHGEAGVGKTRLVEEFGSHLRWQGGRMLWGRCYEFERLLPYQPLGEALQSVLATMSPGELGKLRPWVLDELARLVPELSERLPRLRAGSAVPAEQEQAHLFEGVAHFVAHLSAGGALALIVDDLHWSGESTLQMLHYLARRLAKHPVLIVGTVRPEALEPGSAFDSFGRQLSREGLLSSLTLAGLSPQATESLLLQMSGGGDAVLPVAHRLYMETEGNPLFLTESIKALFETGLLTLAGGAWAGDFARLSRAELPLPQGVSQAIRARVRRLDEEARRALDVAAVLGREFDFDLLSAAWKRSEAATLEAMDTLLRRRFIDEGSGPLGRDYAFHHHKIQEVVYAGIPLRRRQHLHAQAGRALETLSAPDLEAVAGELAHHFGQGRVVDRGLTPKAIRYLLLAGDQARLAYAHQEAVGYYQQALALQKKQGEYEQAGHTLMKLGLVHHTTFDFAQAHRAFEEGLALWQESASREPRASLPRAPHPLRIRWRCPYTLDPLVCGDYVSAMVIDQLFRGLVSTAPDLGVVPEVAQSWQVLEDGRRYRFDLRPDTRWSDGTPLTAHDFEYAWKRGLDPATGATLAELLAIKGARAFHRGECSSADQVGVRALDDLALEVELEEPVSHFLYALADVNAYPVPRHAVTAHGAAWTDRDRIVGNGPFCLEAWDKGSSMRLARNPLYAGRRRGNVEQVVLHFPQDESTQDLSAPLDQYLRGDLDILTLSDASVHEADRIRRQYAADYVGAPWPFAVYLGFVTSRPPFDDVRLRQALALAIDRDELANRVLRGVCSPGTGGLVPPGMPGHSPQTGLPCHPDQARELLAACGHSGGSGLPILDGLSVPPIDPLVTRYLQARWQEHLGIRVAWDVADWPPFKRRLQHDPPHMYLLATFADWPDPSCVLDHEVERRRTRWTCQEYEELMAEARRILDQEARLRLLRQADRLLMREAPVVPLFYGRQHLLVKPWVRNFHISALNRWYWQDTILEPH
jgi:ABC-type oligopeptide transport system substrate-binding subunit/DNA-binding SARP family transcriptional activator